MFEGGDNSALEDVDIGHIMTYISYIHVVVSLEIRQPLAMLEMEKLLAYLPSCLLMDSPFRGKQNTPQRSHFRMVDLSIF